MRMKKILITGMSGLIGGLLSRHLARLGGYELSALNRRPVDGVECFQADIADLEAIKPAFVGVDAVVHLAAFVRNEWQPVLSSNIIGTYNVFEAARLAGVGRVVFASSGATVSGWESVPPYDAIADGRYDEVPERWAKITRDSVRPRGVYGASKVWGEAIGRHFSDAYGISVICARIGEVAADDRPTAPRHHSIYLSHRDVVDFLHRCIAAPDDLKYEVLFATSGNRWGYRDLEHPRRVLGYVPQDSAETSEEPG